MKANLDALFVEIMLNNKELDLSREELFAKIQQSKENKIRYSQEDKRKENKIYCVTGSKNLADLTGAIAMGVHEFYTKQRLGYDVTALIAPRDFLRGEPDTSNYHNTMNLISDIYLNLIKVCTDLNFEVEPNTDLAQELQQELKEKEITIDAELEDIPYILQEAKRKPSRHKVFGKPKIVELRADITYAIPELIHGCKALDKNLEMIGKKPESQQEPEQVLSDASLFQLSLIRRYFCSN